jgi:lysozyme
VRAQILDLSNWNSDVDFDAFKRAGVVGVYNKATEGTGYRDPTYPSNRVRAAGHGLVFGGYLFLHPNRDPRAQAAAFLEYAKLKRGDLRPVIDAEVTDGRTTQQVAQAILDCARRLRAAGVNPILYGSPSFLAPLAAAVPALKTLDVWQAQYAPRRWAIPFHVLLWQFSDHYVVGRGRFDGDTLLVRNLAALRIGGTAPKRPPAVFRALFRLFKGRWYASVEPTPA